MPELHHCLTALLATVPHRRRLVVGVSGGVDSLLLLDLAAGAAAGRLPLVAIHVHHGLSPNADAWAEAVAAQCAGRGVDCTVRRVDVPRAVPSREGAARAARYAAFADLLEPGDALLLGHHADDQAETLLLRLLRGAGLGGLGAMRAARPFGAVDDVWLLRPLLEVPRAAIVAEAARRGLAWIDDESNRDASLDRNFLRHEVMPRLAARWPGLPATFGRAARLAAEADDLLQGYLDTDLAPALATDGTLDATLIATAAAPRARALLRRWLMRREAPALQEDWLDELRALAASRVDAEGELRVGGWEFHRFRGRLVAFPQLPPADPARVIGWPPGGPVAILDLGAGHGTLYAGATEAGPALAIPAGAGLTVRFRAGGERLTPAGGAGSRPLKKVLQDLDVPPWLRHRLPLLYVDDRLAAVADLAVDEAFAPGPDRPATFRLRWAAPPAL